MSIEGIVPEKQPVPGLFHSSNGHIFFGGHELLKVQDAVLRTSQGGARYPSIGTKYQQPYRTLTTVTGSIRQALLNFYTFAFAIGLPANQDTNRYLVGEILESADGTTPIPVMTLIDEILQKSTGNRPGNLGNYYGLPKNHYPIKTTAEFVINEDLLPSSDPAATDLTDVRYYREKLKVWGIMINTHQITVRTGGDVIMAGPFEWIGETYRMTVEEDT